MSRRMTFLILSTLTLTVGFAPLGFAQNGQLLDFKPGEVIVGYRSEADRRASERLFKSSVVANSFSALGTQKPQKVEVKPFRDTSLLLKVSQPSANNAFADGSAAAQRRVVDDLANQLKKIDPKVSYVYPHYVLGIPDQKPVVVNEPQLKKLLSAASKSSVASPNSFPNDPELANGIQWDFQPLPIGMNAVGAWKITTGDRKVVVAVVDTGILGSHPDVAGSGNLLRGYNFVSDGGGRSDDPTDPNPSSHGSNVASIIGAAATNNNLDVAGINWSVSVLPVRVLNESGGGSADDVADGILWAAGLAVPGAPKNSTPSDIINLSLGADFACDQMPRVKEAVEKARAAGSVVVVAAGNSRQDIAGAYPASCSGVISVAAADSKGHLSSYSNFGSVSIVAPGGDVDKEGNKIPIVGIGGSGILGLMGTSQAAPHVSGAIALAMAKHQDWRRHPDVVATAIRDTAVPMPAGACSQPCGPGQLDAQRLVEYEASPTKPPLTASISSALPAVQKVTSIRTASTANDLSGRWLMSEGGTLIISGDEWSHPSKGTAAISIVGQENVVVRYSQQSGVTCSYRFMLMDNGSTLHLDPTNVLQPEEYCPNGRLTSTAQLSNSSSTTPRVKSEPEQATPNGIVGRWLMTTGGVLVIGKADWAHPGKGTADLTSDDGGKLIVQYPQQTGVKCSYRTALLDNGKTLQLNPTNNLQPEEYCPAGRLTASP